MRGSASIRFRVITASGISDVRLFYVTPFPIVAEAEEDKTRPTAPQPVALGTTVFGRHAGRRSGQVSRSS